MPLVADLPGGPPAADPPSADRAGISDLPDEIADLADGPPVADLLELLPGALPDIQTVQFVWRVAMNLESIVSVDIPFTLVA